MSKRKNWLCGITRCFSEPHHHHHHHHHHKQQKRSKRRRIWLFGRLKRTEDLLLPSPSPPPPVQTTKLEVEEEQSKWEAEVVLVDHRCEKDIEILGAIKIQTAYRGYLARKALRALKGFVRLQAIIRGQAVRKQAMTTFKCLQAIVNIQSQVCTTRGKMALGEYTDLQLQGLHDYNLKKTKRMEINKHGRLDDALLPNEDEVETIVERKEAILRRQRSKAHTLNHRISTDSEEGNVEGHLRYWLERYVNDQVLSNKERKILPKHLKLKNTEYLDSLCLHRRSFHTHRKQSSSENTGLSPGSPTASPAYMAATESARARARSMSTPRPRLVLVDRACSDGDSPCKHKSIISPMSSARSEMTCGGFSRVSNKSSFFNSQVKSPTLKGLPSPVRSNRKKLGGG